VEVFFMDIAEPLVEFGVFPFAIMLTGFTIAFVPS